MSDKSQPTRIERWRRQATARIALMEEKQIPGLPLLKACAEIEGVTPVDLIVHSLMRNRFDGNTVTKRPEDCLGGMYNAYSDTYYENDTSVRARNDHEQTIVRREINNYSILPSRLLNDPHDKPGYATSFIRRYYRKGDNGTYKAFERMIEDSLMRCASKSA